MFWEATTNSGVPVFVVRAFFWRTKAFARDIVEIIVIIASGRWVLNTNARASFSVVD